MRKFKGVVKFVSNEGNLALVEQYALSDLKQATNIIIGYTEDVTDLIVDGDLLVSDQSIIKEDSLDITFGTSPVVEGEDISLATSTGLQAILASSTGAVVVDGIVEIDGIEYDGTTGEYGTIVGANISSVDLSLVNYKSGDVSVAASASIGATGTPVKATFSHYHVDKGAEKVVMLRGDFSDVSIDDVIYYYYSADSNSEIIRERLTI